MTRSPLPRVGPASDTAAGRRRGAGTTFRRPSPFTFLGFRPQSVRCTSSPRVGTRSLRSPVSSTWHEAPLAHLPPAIFHGAWVSVGLVPAYSTGRAKTNSESPAPAPSNPGRNPSTQPPHPVGTAMYCRPSTMYVLGLLWCPLPHWNSHSFSPVSASRATNSPVGVPWNTSPPAVVRVDAHIGYSLRQRHFSSPETGSMAATYP